MNMDRRTVLEIGLIALAGGLWGCEDSATQAQSKRILDTRKDLKSAKVVGQLWLDSIKENKARDGQAPGSREIVASLTKGAPGTPEELTVWLRERHIDDLRSGRCEEVNGWVLSQTESLIYGLAALSA